MIFFDIIFIGLYTILANLYKINSNSYNWFGPKEHAFYISIALHTINLQTIWSFISITYLHKPMNMYIFFIIVIGFILLGYHFYYKRERAIAILKKEYTGTLTLIYIFISILYIIITVYFMITNSNHNRETLTNQSPDSIKNEIIGNYIATPDINTLDSLTIYDNAKYVHSIYDKKNNHLVHRNIGKWEINNERITLIDFYLNKDESYSKSKETFTFSFPYKKISTKIIILFGNEMDEHIYTKR